MARAGHRGSERSPFLIIGLTPYNLKDGYSVAVQISLVGYRFPISSTCLLPFVSLETRRIPASSSFISSRLSSLKLTSPRFDLSFFSRSMSALDRSFPELPLWIGTWAVDSISCSTPRSRGEILPEGCPCYGFGSGLLFSGTRPAQLQLHRELTLALFSAEAS